MKIPESPEIWKLFLFCHFMKWHVAPPMSFSWTTLNRVFPKSKQTLENPEYDCVKMSDDENRPLAAQVGANDQENRENFHPNEQENQVQANSPQSQISQFVSKTKLKVTVKGWNGVASWKWIANDDTCGICRYSWKIQKNRKIFQKIAFFSGLPSTVVVRIAKVPETIVHLSGELVPIVSTSTALWNGCKPNKLNICVQCVVKNGDSANNNFKKKIREI